MDEGYKADEYLGFLKCINLYIPGTLEELLEIDTETIKVTNINWRNVNRALLKKLREGGYVTFSEDEGTLLALFDSLSQQENLSLDTKTLTTLIPHGYELAQCLEFFGEWSIEQKVAFVFAYTNSKSPKEQIEVLSILHNEAPQLTVQLKTEPSLQAIYFSIAIAKKKCAAVRTYVEQGANINEALPLLFSEAHKSESLYWLHENPFLIQKMTATGLNATISKGKYQGKTVAEVLVSTKKGRQLLSENNELQALLSQTNLPNTLTDILNQAQRERITVNTQEGFFKKPNLLVIQLGQSVVYGDLKESEKVLQANPSLVKTLLTEKVTVKDYSGRKIKQKTAFQAALCAMDDELCEMLANYMTKEEIVSQYQAIFPNGHAQYYQEQAPFDLSQIVDAISNSSEEDIQIALDLELPNNTELWNSLEQFRADFTNRSYQETVFNPQHLIEACNLYDSQYKGWNRNQQDLFWRQVIGYEERFLPANIAMVFAQGLYYRVETREKSNRSFQFKYGGGQIFPLAFGTTRFGLGYEFWAGSLQGSAEGDAPRKETGAGELLEKLFQQKNRTLGGVMQSSSPVLSANMY